MKILCYINHFFGQNPFFQGKSSLPLDIPIDELERRAKRRKEHVDHVISSLKALEGAEVKVCGVSGFSVVPLDITFDEIKGNPLLLIYESLNHMANFVDQYDYFINIEDDVLLPGDTFQNIVRFDQRSLINEVFLPNRMEKSPEGEQYCVDLKAIPGWTQQRKAFENKQVRVALNAHSAVMILSQAKFRYALSFVDRNFRKPILHNELDSAFAYFHSPFALYRSVELMDHHVVHLDRWMYSAGENNHESPWRYRFKSISASDFVPPILTRTFEFLRRRLTAKK